MRLIHLMGYVMVMWLMILAVAALLVVVVPQLDAILIRVSFGRLTVSIIEAIISISLVVMLIFVLSKMSEYYIQRKLHLKD
jgi:uncharacterized protein YqhQ